VLKQGNEAVAAKRYGLLRDLNQQFHQELSAAGRNRVLSDLLKRLRERTAMLFAPTDPIRQARSWDEHAGILRAIIADDGRAAATLAAEHVMRAGADFLATLHIPDEAPSLQDLSASQDKTSRVSCSPRPAKVKSIRRSPDK
jgi:DNA-binding GntR family transcriptional regulator